MGRDPSLARRHKARRRLDLARRDGNEDDVVARATRSALARACKRDDIVAKSDAVANAASYSKVQEQARDLAAAGEEADTRDAAAYTVIAQNEGRNSVEVQAEAMAVDEEREKFEQHRVENGARLIGNYAGKLGRKTVTVDGPLLLALRKKGVQDQAAYRERGCVPKDYDGTGEEHIALLGKKQCSDLAYYRNRRQRARQGIDKGSLPADVVAEIYEGCQVFEVNPHLEPPPDEKRELYETPEEAFAVATRWREFWDKPRDAVRAAKTARGGVPNVDAHTRNEDLFCVTYKNRHRGKSRYVREPGTGGSWYYDWDAALQLKEDYEKSNKDASWFVSQAEAKEAGKARQAAAGAKGRASQKRKAKP